MNDERQRTTHHEIRERIDSLVDFAIEEGASSDWRDYLKPSWDELLEAGMYMRVLEILDGLEPRFQDAVAYLHGIIDALSLSIDADADAGDETYGSEADIDRGSYVKFGRVGRRIAVKFVRGDGREWTWWTSPQVARDMASDLVEKATRAEMEPVE